MKSPTNSESGMPGIARLEPISMNQMIRSRLMDYISDEGLAAGDKLPSESALTQALGISRIALREALRGMEALGMIEARAGSGWYVSDFSFDAIARGMAYNFELNQHNFADLVEIRIRLEHSYLPEAMARLTGEDFAGLEASVQAIEHKAAAGQDFFADDRDFHRRLFVGKVQNEMFMMVLDMFWLLYPHLPAPPSDRETLLQDARRHRLFLEALGSGDVELAARRLQESFQGAFVRTSQSAQGNAPAETG
jgi:DNA-binding FadR family transcriptional regulator